MKTLDQILAEHPFFRGLGTEHLKFIAGCGHNVHFRAGQQIFREGDSADLFYVVHHGTALVEINVPGRGPVTVQTITEGEILGWSWLFPPYRWRFDALARDEISATVFDGACLRKKCDSDPVLGYELMKRLSEIVSTRLLSTLLQSLDVYGGAHHLS
jgi:CRP/FNR family cyclic AMP-dependent transcriptional regulator